MMTITRKERLLMVSFAKPQMVLSWAVHGGGGRQARTIAWYQVTPRELKLAVNAKQFLERRLKENNILEAVGMLTSADLDAYAEVEKRYGDLSVRSVATVGMTNALRAGDPVRVRPGLQSLAYRQPKREPIHVGTINLLCAISVPLSEEAHLEALSIAVEARTAAVLEARIPSIETGMPATGTGTDCVVIAAPCPASALCHLKLAVPISSKHSTVPPPKKNQMEHSTKPIHRKDIESQSCAGKHTALGHLIGKSVFDAVSLGLELLGKKNP